MLAELQTFLISMTPVFELRGAIPFALLSGINPYLAYTIAVIGNIIPVFLIFGFFVSVSKWLSAKFGIMKTFFDFLFLRTRNDYQKRIEKYGYFALFIFTAIPLPITGAWTASLAAILFRLSYKKAMIAIICGVLLAGKIVMAITLIGLEVKDYQGAQIVGGLIVLILFFYLMHYIKKHTLKQ
ncbi:MAG: small multi-drug export protein [Candidatus Pacebacteria bacterium]|nr:small multi-drug export protein [Candidatus Paceibacterota bacterium]